MISFCKIFRKSYDVLVFHTDVLFFFISICGCLVDNFIDQRDDNTPKKSGGVLLDSVFSAVILDETVHTASLERGPVIGLVGQHELGILGNLGWDQDTVCGVHYVATGCFCRKSVSTERKRA